MGLISNIITNAVNKNIADQNLGFQKETFEYNKALQQQQWEREDTSYQRTAQDMLAAGLNPLSMQGTNGAGEVVSQTAPQNNFQMQQTTGSLMDTITGAINGMAQIKTGKLERDALALENDRKKLENLVYAERHGINLEEGTVDDPYDYTWSPEQKRNYEHDESIGRYSNDSDFEKLLTTIEQVAGSRGKEFLENVKKSELYQTFLSLANQAKDKLEEKSPVVTPKQKAAVKEAAKPENVKKSLQQQADNSARSSHETQTTQSGKKSGKEKAREQKNQKDVYKKHH